jgi:hypothetical protein
MRIGIVDDPMKIWTNQMGLKEFSGAIVSELWPSPHGYSMIVFYHSIQLLCKWEWNWRKLKRKMLIWDFIHFTLISVHFYEITDFWRSHADLSLHIVFLNWDLHILLQLIGWRCYILVFFSLKHLLFRQDGIMAELRCNFLPLDGVTSQ